jgi:hypothetical protein
VAIGKQVGKFSLKATSLTYSATDTRGLGRPAAGGSPGRSPRCLSGRRLFGEPESRMALQLREPREALSLDPISLRQELQKDRPE